MFYMRYMDIEQGLFIAVILGCVAGVVVGLVTEYYTSGKPVRDVADSAQSGAATNIIYGLSVGMESTVLPVIILALIVLAAFTLRRIIWRCACCCFNACYCRYYHDC